MNLDQIRSALVQDGRGLLLEIEETLLALETEGFNVAQVNAVFRAAHTIKGSAGLFGLQSLISFVHCMESLLDQVRNGEHELDGVMLSLLLSCGDYIGSLLTAVEENSEANEPSPELRAHLLQQLDDYLPKTASSEVPSQSQVLAGEHGAESIEEVQSDVFSSDLWPNAQWHRSYGLSGYPSQRRAYDTLTLPTQRVRVLTL